jgi:hypothetical protein
MVVVDNRLRVKARCNRLSLKEKLSATYHHCLVLRLSKTLLLLLPLEVAEPTALLPEALLLVAHLLVVLQVAVGPHRKVVLLVVVLLVVVLLVVVLVAVPLQVVLQEAREEELLLVVLHLVVPLLVGVQLQPVALPKAVHLVVLLHLKWINLLNGIILTLRITKKDPLQLQL